MQGWRRWNSHSLCRLNSSRSPPFRHAVHLSWIPPRHALFRPLAVYIGPASRSILPLRGPRYPQFFSNLLPPPFFTRDAIYERAIIIKHHPVHVATLILLTFLTLLRLLRTSTPWRRTKLCIAPTCGIDMQTTTCKPKFDSRCCTKGVRIRETCRRRVEKVRYAVSFLYEFSYPCPSRS